MLTAFSLSSKFSRRYLEVCLIEECPNNLDAVNKYYASGIYFDAFKAMDTFTNVFTLPYCSIIKPYFGTRTSGVFGDIEKMHLQNILMHQLYNLIKAD